MKTAARPAPSEIAQVNKTITWLAPGGDREWFPPIDQALDEPEGLLAAGGDLSVARLLAAYRRGIFPWYSAGQPVLWWSPNPREILLPGEFKCSRSLVKTIRNRGFVVAFDRDFAGVVRACAERRENSPGTWITPEMHAAYCELHRQGHAHSVELHVIGALSEWVKGRSPDGTGNGGHHAPTRASVRLAAERAWALAGGAGVPCDPARPRAAVDRGTRSEEDAGRRAKTR